MMNDDPSPLTPWVVTWLDDGKNPRANLVWASDHVEAWEMAGKPDIVWVVHLSELDPGYSLSLQCTGNVPAHWIPPDPEKVN